MDNKPSPLTDMLQDLHEYVAHAYAQCTGGWKSRAEFIMNRLVEIQEQAKREEKTMSEGLDGDALEVHFLGLAEMITDTVRRYEKENRALKEEVAALNDLISRDRRGAPQNGSEPVRYHGCYNLAERRTPIEDFSDVVMILGGVMRAAEEIGVAPSSISDWRNKNALPKQYAPRVIELLEERRYKLNPRMITSRTRLKKLPMVEE